MTKIATDSGDISSLPCAELIEASAANK